MKTTILFMLLAFPFLHKHIPPKTLIISHSKYKAATGIACVLYHEKVYYMEWFQNPVLKAKEWKIKEVNGCNLWDRNSILKEDFKDSRRTRKEIQKQLSQIRSTVPHPE